MTIARLALVLAVFVAAACGPKNSHGGPVSDHVSFVDNLRARGLTVDLIGEMRTTPLEVSGIGLAVSGGGLRGSASMLSFDYRDADLGRDGRIAAEEDAAEIAGDITRVRTAGGVSLPSGPAHFYRKERVVVMYVGGDPEMLRILTDLFGPQFAGAR